MNREVCEIICRMDPGKIENQLALQCAPLIVGLRISSLLITDRKNIGQIYGVLGESRIRWYVLHVTAGRAVVLLYRSQGLVRYLRHGEIRDFLLERKYPLERIEDILCVFRTRYRRYCMDGGEFPHELGLILGYPIEDVKGFIRYGGRNPLYAGCWKVYGDLPAKRELFYMFGLAKELLVELLANGADIREIVREYGGNEWE